MSACNSLRRLRRISLPFHRSCAHLMSTTQSRPLSFLGLGSKNKRRRTPNKEESGNPVMRAYLQRQRENQAALNRARRKQSLPDDPSPEAIVDSMAESAPNSGGLAKNSIMNNTAFDESPESLSSLYGNQIPTARLFALDPKPEARRRFERRMIIQEIRRRGRVSEEIKIMRTERGIKVKSPFIRTSMKKLSPLANQIVGKTIEEAILQMEFSKKRAAVAVKEHLEMARDKAIVDRGMGLGSQQGTSGQQTMIRLKDGTPHIIRDQTGIYVDQAWVGKGSYGRDRNRRARGRTDLLKLPQTSISVYLKEEKTRVREFNEREERAAKRKPWVQMPDRPLPDQRQYYTW